MKSMKRLAIRAQLTIYSDKHVDDGIFSIGVATLLRGIIDTGSLLAAAKRISMAYSKAWRLMKDAEASFGFDLIIRDGARGSTLTKEGLRLLEIYELLQQEAADFISVRFSELIAGPKG